MMSEQPEQPEQHAPKPDEEQHPKYDALVTALQEKGISTAFMTNDETWRKRALGFGTQEDTYQEMKDTHKWLYDQPITPESMDPKPEEPEA